MYKYANRQTGNIQKYNPQSHQNSWRRSMFTTISCCGFLLWILKLLFSGPWLMADAGWRGGRRRWTRSGRPAPTPQCAPRPGSTTSARGQPSASAHNHKFTTNFLGIPSNCSGECEKFSAMFTFLHYRSKHTPKPDPDPHWDKKLGSTTLSPLPVLRIRDVYPRSRFPDPKQQQKRGVKKNCCHTLFCSHKFHKTENYFVFELLKKKFGPIFKEL